MKNFRQDYLPAVFGAITVIVGLFGFGYLKGKQKSDSKHEKEKQKEAIKEQEKIIDNYKEEIKTNNEIRLNDLIDKINSK